METTVKVCFYCKHLVSEKDQVCPHCKRAARSFEVRVAKVLKSPKWKFWNRKYYYYVIDPKFNYIEKKINKGSTNG